MIIYGRHKIIIKKYTDNRIKCENCGEYIQHFRVYQEYFHLFFIPFFPIGVKTISTSCGNCNEVNGEKTNYYLNMTRTPFYMYAGIILFTVFAAFLIVSNINTQKQKAEFIAYPQAGDVYLIRENSNVYYFLKVQSVHADTVKLMHSAMQYDGFVSSMVNSDYFVRESSFPMLHDDIKSLLEEGVINSVERGYKPESRFTIEN